MNPVIEEALDALGLALAAHGHQWTPRERALYERAIRAVSEERERATAGD